MQNEITKKTKLLSKNGELINPGYSKKMLYNFNKENIKGNSFCLKEWDFYQISHGDYIIQLVIGHVSYASSFTATLFNIKTGERKSITKMGALPLKNIPMSKNPELPHYIEINLLKFKISFNIKSEFRHLKVNAIDKKIGIIDINIKINNDVNNDKMVIAVPFENRKQFYLNYKENYYGLSGYLQMGTTNLVFNKNDTAVLDWGRGVWPLNHQWFWGNGTGYLKNNDKFGFNIGWGFGKENKSNENMFFYNKKAYKLSDLVVTANPYNYMDTWHFLSKCGNFNLKMTPIYDNYTTTKILFVDNKCHQVFGEFNGYIKLPDDKQINIKNFLAFCEHAVNRW